MFLFALRRMTLRFFPLDTARLRSCHLFLRFLHNSFARQRFSSAFSHLFASCCHCRPLLLPFPPTALPFHVHHLFFFSDSFSTIFSCFSTSLFFPSQFSCLQLLPHPKVFLPVNVDSFFYFFSFTDQRRCRMIMRERDERRNDYWFDLSLAQAADDPQSSQFGHPFDPDVKIPD